MKNPIKKTLNISEIKPYWRNPRENKDAVIKVKKSIEEFGYNNLISVDNKNVIITGHTRFKALVELGHKEIDVVQLDLDAQQAKRYRIVDNKTSEIATWNENLILELREIENIDFMKDFFNEDISKILDKSIGAKALENIISDDIKKAEKKIGDQIPSLADSYKDTMKEVTCPECSHSFKVK